MGEASSKMVYAAVRDVFAHIQLMPCDVLAEQVERRTMKVA
jgi:hypothetical protein